MIFKDGLEHLNKKSDKSSSVENNDNDEQNILDHDHHDGIGYWGSVAHIVRAAAGTGILILPMEMKSLGYINGSLLLIGVTLIYYHILHILLNLNFRLQKHLNLKYSTFAVVVDKIFTVAPSPFRQCRRPVVYLIYIYYMMPIDKAMTLILISSNIQNMAQYIDIDLNFTWVITCLSIFLCSCCMFRSVFKALVPFSSASNLCYFASLVVVIIYSIIYRNPEGNVRPFAGDVSLVLKNTSICLNAAFATNIILPVCNAMKKPRKMVSNFGSLYMSAFIVVIVYTAFALITYINFGDEVQGDILENLPVDNLFLLSVKFIFTLTLTVPYVLLFYACFDVIWMSEFQSNLPENKCKCIIEYSIRFGYNALAYFFALVVPNLSLLASLAGVIGILLDVAIMPLLQLLLMYASKEKNYWIFCKNLILIAFCLVLFVLSVNNFIEELSKLYEP